MTRNITPQKCLIRNCSNRISSLFYSMLQLLPGYSTLGPLFCLSPSHPSKCWWGGDIKATHCHSTFSCTLLCDPSSPLQTHNQLQPTPCLAIVKPPQGVVHYFVKKPLAMPMYITAQPFILTAVIAKHQLSH